MNFYEKYALDLENQSDTGVLFLLDLVCIGGVCLEIVLAS